MVYRKRPSKSRRYKKAGTQESSQKEPHVPAAETPLLEGAAISATEENRAQERKKSQPLGFLSSFFGGDKMERSGSPLFSLFDFDLYLDDLILAGLIILLLTDKVQDEILLIVLLYLLLDMF